MTNKKSKLLFVDAHEPAMLSGHYQVQVTQPLPGIESTIRSQSASFHVLGPRYTLKPGWIDSRFPPRMSSGDHAGVLPHVVLSRSSLPWERDARAAATQPTHPWLALLVFNQEELLADGSRPASIDTTVSLGDLASSNSVYPVPSPEPGETDDQRVRILDIPRSVLEPILPDESWLRHLTHVREHIVAEITPTEFPQLHDNLNSGALDENGFNQLRRLGITLPHSAKVQVELADVEWRIEDPESGRTLYVERNSAGTIVVANEPRAIVISARALLPGQHYRAYLVSVAQRYSQPVQRQANNSNEKFSFDFSNAGANDLIRLVALDSWDFSVIPDAGKLEHLMQQLAIPKPQATAAGPILADGSLALKIPDTNKTGTGIFSLSEGFAPLTHFQRNGGKTLSWYRGPCVNRQQYPNMPQLPVHTSDALLFVDQDSGLLYAHYAAAWELGRQLMLSNQTMNLALLDWKMTRQHQIHRDNMSSATPHLHRAQPQQLTLPDNLINWFQRLALLDGVPFGYLVPDPQMLPQESIRTFLLDEHWLFCLIDGAFSAGRVLAQDVYNDHLLYNELVSHALATLRTDGDPVDLNQPMPPVSGYLIRSEIISGWPDLHIDAYSDNAATQLCHVVRRTKLSDNVLLILCAEKVERIDLHPNPEALHHGLKYFSPETNNDPVWGVEHRELTGEPGVALRTPTMRSKTLRSDIDDVLDISEERRSDQGDDDYSPEELGLRLIAGVPKVSILVQ